MPDAPVEIKEYVDLLHSFTALHKYCKEKCNGN